MRIAMYYSNRDVRLEEMPVPQIGPGEVLMRVEASGICGTDLLEWYRLHKAPLVLGHEVAGVVAAVGKGVKPYKVGDRICAAHHVPCNTCHYCLSGHHTVCDTLRRTNFDPGGFAEYLRLPRINVEQGIFPLPDIVSFEEATFVEPLACVLRGQRLARLQPGQTVLVIGSGVAGLLHIQLARASGAGRIIATDIVDYRLEAARKFGADAAIQAREYSPDYLRGVADGRLADLVVICSGAQSAINEALGSVERGGTVLFFAPTEPGASVPISVNDLFWRNETTLTSSYGGSPADYAAALELIQAGKIRVREMITHRLGLAETGLGFQLVARAQDSLKVIIEPRK
ncbi:MAG: zinc-dependent dehydrogenase [Dehalococcoidia bacterium]|nr:zinc-dependent dehydrogenase [Dehalococcoidia bacterium]MDH4299860.1 zinc-dependent dehydrogenase [Dehalococcoidia bacterium]MDH4367663.1 zinc-dependent dehydrogenase [Dehalococcoidia bacterium]